MRRAEFTDESAYATVTGMQETEGKRVFATMPACTCTPFHTLPIPAHCLPPVKTHKKVMLKYMLGMPWLPTNSYVQYAIVWYTREKSKESMSERMKILRRRENPKAF